MKKLLLLAVSSFLFLLNCSVQTKTLPDGKQLDTRLSGVWAGSEKNQQIDGVSKSWEMKRFDDGHYTIDFTFTQDGETNQTHEEGKWWTENGKYYELHSYDNKIDTYTYNVLDNNRVKFKTESISIDMENAEYEFIDTKIGNARKEPTIKRDGSSFEKAIKVSSVPEEYQYVRANCSGCKLKSQALSENKGRFYEIITVINPDGTEKSYYFDVTSFYGKGF